MSFAYAGNAEIHSGFSSSFVAHYEVTPRDSTSHFLELVPLCPCPQLATFSDASFATLSGSGSVESACVVFGIPVSMDDTVLRYGLLISWYTRLIHRVCRPAANSECVDFLTRSSAFPMMNPLKHSTTSLPIQHEFHSAMSEMSRLKNKIVSPHLSVSPSSGSSDRINLSCADCFSSTSVPLSQLVQEYDTFAADVGTKINATLGICYRLSDTNSHRIGFVARKDCHRVAAALRDENVVGGENGTRGNSHINSP